MSINYLQRKFIGSPKLRLARWNMQRSGLNELFAHRPAEAKPPQSIDLWNLYRNVRSRCPAVVLELGCGCSTLVMAEAMNHNGGGKLIVLEADEGWLNYSQNELPERLKPFVEYRHAPLVMIEVDGEACHVYSNLPTGSIDLLYLDGPDPAHVPNWPIGGHPTSADPVILEPKFNKGFRMIVDSRKVNVAFLKRRLKRDYRVKTDDIFGITSFDLLG